MRAVAKGAVVGLALAAGLASARAEAPVEPLTLDTSTGAHRFKVEVMRTEPERERGLMFRKSMAHDHGMLFEYKQAQPLAFWMHNTYLPLDIVFIDSGGHVINVAANAKPMDNSLIQSAGPALGVLELDAGTAAAVGLKPGDIVRHAMFGDAKR